MWSALKTSLIVVMVMTISGLVKCAPGGGTGSECGIRISGSLQEPCGTPAQNTLITMRPREYLALQRQLGKRITEYGYVYVTTTDSKGRYSFTAGDSISEGIYCIEARDEKNGNCIFIDSIVIDSQILNSDTPLDIKPPYVKTDNTLRPPSSISGTIQLPDSSDGGMMFVYGLNTSVVFKSDGSFKIDNLPAGNLRLQVIVSHSGNEQESYLPVTTLSGTPTTLGTLYGVFYNGNGNTGGSTPAVNSLFSLGDTVILPGNTGMLEKSDSVFIGWNTNSDGSGVWYEPGDTLIIDTATMMLYAKWTKGYYLLTAPSDGNGKVNGSGLVAQGVPHAITAVPDSGSHFSFWRVTSGMATIADSFASSTTVILEHGDATVEGVFSDKNTFLKTFEGSAATSMQQTYDGGYIIASANLIKTDVNGDISWTRNSGIGSAYSIKQTTDGGYIISGYTRAAGNDDENNLEKSVYLTKADSNGITIWSKMLGKNSSDTIIPVQQTNDGGYIIVGNWPSAEIGGFSSYLIKTNTIGDTIWTRAFGDSGSNYTAVQQTTDNGYVIAGTTESYDGTANRESASLIKINSNGDVVWTKRYVGIGWCGKFVQQTSDGGYIIAGGSGNDYVNVLLIKTNAKGDPVWTREIKGDFENSAAKCYSIQQTNDEGFIIGGSNYNSKALIYNIYMIKTDVTGNTSWTRRFSKVLPSTRGRVVQQTSDGGFIILGTNLNSTNIYLIKTDEYGIVE